MSPESDSGKAITWLTDDEGRRWAVERVGRTSGTIATKKARGPVPGPADVIRFRCESDSAKPQREATVPAGLIERLSEVELRELFRRAPVSSASL